jgi:hypothetical protein
LMTGVNVIQRSISVTKLCPDQQQLIHHRIKRMSSTSTSAALSPAAACFNPHSL